MDEKRRSKRAPFNSKISIESFYKSGDKDTLKVTTEITIINISKTGIGFITDIVLPLNHFFNCKIEIDDERTIFCVLKVIRLKKINNGYHVGAEFVGLADIIGEYINDYVDVVDE